MLLWITDLEECHFVQYKPGNLWQKAVLDVLIVKRDHEFIENALPSMLSFCASVDEYNATHTPVHSCIPKPPVIDVKRHNIDIIRETEYEVQLLMEEERATHAGSKDTGQCICVDTRIDDTIRRMPSLITFDYNEELRRIRLL